MQQQQPLHSVPFSLNRVIDTAGSVCRIEPSCATAQTDGRSSTLLFPQVRRLILLSVVVDKNSRALPSALVLADAPERQDHTELWA